MQKRARGARLRCSILALSAIVFATSVSGLLPGAVSFRGCTGEISITAGWVGPEGTPRG
jgi:hypothetical protein